MGYAARVCSYCKKHLGWVKADNFAPNEQGKLPISHGICPECRKREMAKMQQYLSANPPSETAKRMTGDAAR